MPTEDEKELELRRRRLKLKMRRAKAAEEPKPEPKPEPQSGLDKLRGGVQSFNRGSMLGFGDEIVAGARTGIDMLSDVVSGRVFGDEELQSIGDRYAMYAGDERDVTEQFAAENPKTALALNVAGAIASPVNRVAPGVGSSGGVASRAAQLAGRGGVEGGIAGFGETDGDFGERIQGALDAAQTGAVFGGGLSLGGGALGRAFSKKRVAEDVSDLATSRPLNIADPESGIGKFYRNVVGLAYGGGGAIGKQESRALNASRKLARFADEGMDLVDETQGTRRAVDDVKARVANDAKIEQGALADEIADAKAVEIPARPKVTKTEINEQVEAGLEKSRAKMRAEQADAALPVGASDDLRGRINTSTDPEEQVRMLDEYWGSKGPGFSSVKSHVFQLDDSLKKFLKNNLDPEVHGDLLKKIDEGSITQIDGELMMDLRNRPLIGKGSQSGMNYGKSRQSARKWDKQIERQLKDAGKEKELNQFLNDKGAYGDFVAFENAVGKAKGRTDLPFFTESDLNKAGGNKSQRTRGVARGQDRAKAVIEEREGLKRALKEQEKAAREAASESTKLAKARKAEEVSRLQNRAKRLKQREKASINRINRETRGLLPEDSTFWSKAAATAGLGAPIAGFTPGGAFATGVVVARTLASPRVQRLVAGQSPVFQKGLREALEAGDTAKVTAMLARAGIQMTEDDE